MSAINQDTAIIGKNIRALRENFGITQETLAGYLNTSREQISYYENGTRSISTEQLSKLANLFCMNEYEFYEEQPGRQLQNIAIAFRADTLTPNDLVSIAQFKKIVRNYMNMKNVMHE